MDRNKWNQLQSGRNSQSLSARRAWIEIGMEINGVSYDVWSLSARRAWIEILKQLLLKTLKAVALRKESVDRNIRSSNGTIDIIKVALRKESVDRNAETV